MEAKQYFQIHDLDQVVAQAVLSSFIHHNRHPDQYALVPAVGISAVEGHVLAVLFDCQFDVLLTSLEVPWLSWFNLDEDRGGGLAIPRVIILWLLLHYRLFLKSLQDLQDQVTLSVITTLFEQAGTV